MKTLLNKRSLSALAGVLILSACHSEWTKQSIGKMSVAIAWPQTGGFSIQTIPDNTDQIRIKVRGTGLNQALERDLKRESGSTQRFELILPTGSKEVNVQALASDGQLLAEATDSVLIQASQTSRLEMDMKPIVLSSPLPGPSNKPGGSSGGSGSGSSGSNSRPPKGDNPPPSDGSNPLDPNASALPSQPPPLMSPPPPIKPPPPGGGGADPLDLIAAPLQVSGLGFPSEMVLLIPPDRLVGLTVDNFTWSCQDTNVLNQPCNNFMTFAAQPNRVIWNSPGIASGPYRISVDFLPPGRNTPVHREVMVTVLSGTGSLGGSNQIGFDGAVEGF